MCCYKAFEMCASSLHVLKNIFSLSLCLFSFTGSSLTEELLRAVAAGAGCALPASHEGHGMRSLSQGEKLYLSLATLTVPLDVTVVSEKTKILL